MTVYGCPPPSSDAGGERGTLYSEREKERVSLPLSPEEPEPPTSADVQATAAAISELLLAEGVLVLSKPRRTACAEAMAAENVSMDELRAVIAFVKETDPEPSNQRRYLAGIFQDATKRKESFHAVRKYHDSRMRNLTDAEFGAAIRRANQRQVVQFEADWNAYVAAKKAAGEPIAGPREAHPWEPNGPVVVPEKAAELKPDTDDEQRQRREQFKREMRQGKRS